MELKERWLEHAGARLFAVEVGSGSSVFILHGGMADHRACMHHIAALSTTFRVIAPDQRGSGKSWWDKPLSFEQLSDDLVAWMDTLQLARAVVIGVSSGTGLAVHFALAHPKRVAGLALLQPIYAGAQQGYTPEQAGIFAWMDGVASQALEHGIEAVRPLYAAAPEQHREQAIAMAMEYDPASIVATSHFLVSGAQPFRSPADLAAIRVPVLLMPGADPLHPGPVSDLYLRNLARVQVLEPQDPSLAAKFEKFCAVSWRENA